MVTFPAPDNLHSSSPREARAESVGWLQSYSSPVSFWITVIPNENNKSFISPTNLCWWYQVTELGKFTWILSWCQMRRHAKCRTASAPEWYLWSIHIYLQCTLLKILALKVYLAISYPSCMLLIFDIWNFTLPKNWPPAWKQLPHLKSTAAGWNSTFSACFQTNLKRKPDQNKHIPSGICLIQ